MLNMKNLMYACMAIIALGNSAMAGFTLPAVPKKFQGAWVCVVGPLTIGASTVSHGGPKDSLKLISIEPGDEGGVPTPVGTLRPDRAWRGKALGQV